MFLDSSIIDEVHKGALAEGLPVNNDDIVIVLNNLLEQAQEIVTSGRRVDYIRIEALGKWMPKNTLEDAVERVKQKVMDKQNGGN